MSDTFWSQETDENNWFDEKYPEAKCHRCDTKVTGSSVVHCGGMGGACETWYCGDCHEEGTQDCACHEEKDDEEEEEKEVLNKELGFTHEGVWVVNPYVTENGRGSCDPIEEYGKTPAELLSIFKSQEYLDWLRVTLVAGDVE